MHRHECWAANQKRVALALRLLLLAFNHTAHYALRLLRLLRLYALPRYRVAQYTILFKSVNLNDATVACHVNFAVYWYWNNKLS